MDTHKAFTDLRFSLEDALSDGDKVVLRVNFSGTNSGLTAHLPATGKRASISGLIMIRLREGRWVEEWDLYDFMGLMQQLGLNQRPGGRPAED